MLAGCGLAPGGFQSGGAGAFSGIAGTASIAQGGTGQATATAGFDALAPTTTRGDIIYRDASNNVRLAKGSSGQVLTMGASDPAWATASGGGFDPFSRTWYAYARAIWNTTTFRSFNITSGTAGTAAANIAVAGRPYIDYVSVATTDQDAGVLAETALAWGQLPATEWQIRTGSSVLVMRAVVGLNNDQTPTAADSCGAECAVFRYSTSVPDTNWVACTSDVTPTQTCTDTGIAIATSTQYLLRVDCGSLPTNCKFYINGALVVTKTTNLPAIAAGTPIGVPVAYLRTLENVAKTISINSGAAKFQQ